MVLTVSYQGAVQLFRGPIVVFARYQNTDSAIMFYFQKTFFMKMKCIILESCVAIVPKL